MCVLRQKALSALKGFSWLDPGYICDGYFRAFPAFSISNAYNFQTTVATDLKLETKSSAHFRCGRGDHAYYPRSKNGRHFTLTLGRRPDVLKPRTKWRAFTVFGCWLVEKWQNLAFCTKIPLFSNPLTYSRKCSWVCFDILAWSATFYLKGAVAR